MHNHILKSQPKYLLRNDLGQIHGLIDQKLNRLIFEFSFGSKLECVWDYLGTCHMRISDVLEGGEDVFNLGKRILLIQILE